MRRSSSDSSKEIVFHTCDLLLAEASQIEILQECHDLPGLICIVEVRHGAREDCVLALQVVVLDLEHRLLSFRPAPNLDTCRIWNLIFATTSMPQFEELFDGDFLCALRSDFLCAL